MAVIAVIATLGSTTSAVAVENHRAVLGSELHYVGKALIVNKFSPDGKKYCLDAHVSNAGLNNSRVGLWECNGGTTLIWNVYVNSTTGQGLYTFINYRWNRALDYPAASNGDAGWHHQIYDYVNSMGQRFWLRYDEDDPHHAMFGLVWNGRYGTFMDAWAVSSGNGNPVGGEGFTGHPRQKWRLEFV